MAYLLVHRHGRQLESTLQDCTAFLQRRYSAFLTALRRRADALLVCRGAKEVALPAEML
jgi:hypothetical protein